MEKVIDTIKLSCEDLKKKEVINDVQYNDCIDLTQKQKWRDELKNEKYKKKVDGIIAKEMAQYKKYKKLIDINFKKLEESYMLSMTNNNDIYTQNTKKYLKNLDKLNAELKNIIVDHQKAVYKKESHNLFRELVAKKALNKTYSKKLKAHDKDLAYIRKKNEILQKDTAQNTNNFTLYITLLIILLLCNAILLAMYFYF
jgi:ATP-dependent exoDNAse (exonuclease V) beta subunit